MRKLVTLLFVLVALAIESYAQKVIVARWNFENETKRNQIDPENFSYTADLGVDANKDVATISLVGGCKFDQWVTGSEGTNSRSPNAKNWADGAGTKYWLVTLSTQGYNSLFVSSKQRTSSTGPRDFKIQYSLDNVNWFDVPNTEIQATTSFSPTPGAGTIYRAMLPNDCNNKATLYLRWIMNSNIAVNNNPVANLGTNRIDEIEILSLNIPQVSIDNRFCGLEMSGTQTSIVATSTNVPVTYEFNIVNEELQFDKIYQSTKRAINVLYLKDLKRNTTYKIRVRSIIDGEIGEWSNFCEFKTVLPAEYSLLPEFCGKEFETMKTIISSNTTPDATKYKYKFWNTELGFETEYISEDPKARIILGKVPGLIHNTTYNVAVSALIAGEWTEYGPACQIKTPSITTKLEADYCNAQLTSFSQILLSEKVVLAENYKYQFTNEELKYFFEYERGANSRALNMYYIKRLKPCTQYNVRVAVKVNGVWGKYGEVCTITTPCPKNLEVSSSEIELMAYPNPSTDNVTIKSSTETDVVIYNSLGQIIRNFSLNETNNFELTISDLESGIYYVVARTENSVETQKIVINR